ncbi:DUF4397 domain-containing protein [Aridibaculum aurantiacum]|uniref:DUF4397 domain-containing protein n=1 Tax=Aridibaculum aurantiacum TaxID=2810307 RepID=UPI001A95CF39|nr:DUF4397 domain-containing protein [Aridibaculum aurantiacum]
MSFSRKIVFSSLAAALGLMGLKSCKPHEFMQESLTSFAVTNTIPGDTLHVVLDGQLHTPPNALGVLFGGTSISHTGAATPYLPAIAGGHTIGLSRDTGKTVYANHQVNLERGVAYTFFAVGTQAQRNFIQLRDNLSLPAENTIKVRFVHAAPSTGPVDVTFARGTTDSVTLTNRTMLSSGNAGTAEVFTQIPVTRGTTTHATSYTIRVKTAGTGNVIASGTTNLGGVFTSPQNKIYTFYLRGGVSNTALGLGVTRNY